MLLTIVRVLLMYGLHGFRGDCHVQVDAAGSDSVGGRVLWTLWRYGAMCRLAQPRALARGVRLPGLRSPAGCVSQAAAASAVFGLPASDLAHGRDDLSQEPIPLEKWFWAIYRLAQDKKGCSAMMLSKEIDVCYPTAWLMTHKIRHAMAHDDSRVLLEHLVELDDAFLGGLQPGKRGRGARYKAPLFVAVERLPDGRLGQAAIEPIRQLRQARLATFAHQHLSRRAVIRSDASPTFGPLRGMGYRHIPERMRGVFKRAVRSLPAVHLVISNLKRFLLGRHHATAPKQSPPRGGNALPTHTTPGDANLRHHLSTTHRGGATLILSFCF